MVGNISEKQREIVKLKAQGKNNREIGDIVYPNAGLKSKSNIVSRELQKSNVAQYYEQEKLVALKEAGITWKFVIDIIKDAATAVTKDGSPAHTVRMSAAREAKSLLETEDKDPNVKDEVQKEFLRIASDTDEAEISRVLFKKSGDG